MNREKKEWINDEPVKLEKCEGLPAPSMWTLLRAMTLAMGHTPQIYPPKTVQQAAVDHNLGHKLMARRSRGDLIVEVDKDVTAHLLHTVIETLESLEATFLGVDEPAAKRLKLEELRQQGGKKAENQIPAYIRLFTQKSNEAYGVVNRAVETKEKLAELYLTSLYSDEVAREIFEHDSPLVMINAVQTQLTEIYNHGRSMLHA